MLRDIVLIDEAKCDGCGLCVPSCHEGALQIVGGKARLVADKLCDGLGVCLGHCPKGAIRIIKRDTEGFDEHAVAAHLRDRTARAAAIQPVPTASTAPLPVGAPRPLTATGGCPGSRLMQFDSQPKPAAAPAEAAASQLTHWPVKLRLLSPEAPVLRGASLLVAADCVPVAYAEFQGKLLSDRAVLIGCPKFDDLELYTERLTLILRNCGLREVVVARMEVPCCAGILHAVIEARRRAAVSVPVHDVVIGVRGQLLTWQVLSVPAERFG
jgi:NAD-dependent dihydropyrimidine dehydrogenase PreA subunit